VTARFERRFEPAKTKNVAFRFVVSCDKTKKLHTPKAASSDILLLSLLLGILSALLIESQCNGGILINVNF